MTNLTLLNKFSSLPENLKKEVEDFIDFLKMKSPQQKAEKQRVLGLAKGMIIMKKGLMIQ